MIKITTTTRKRAGILVVCAERIFPWQGFGRPEREKGSLQI